MAAADFKKELKHLYAPSAKEVSVVEVPELSFLSVDGEGDPAGGEFQAAFGLIYSVAYTLKFMLKKQPGTQDYVMAPPEALWWVEDGDYTNFAQRRGEWRWTLLLRQPEGVTAEQVEAAKAEVLRKKGLAGLEKVRLVRWAEGPAVQIMHVGPYGEETENIARLHAKIAELGGRPRGKHHEIYLSDPRRAAAEKMRTVLRQPYAV